MNKKSAEALPSAEIICTLVFYRGDFHRPYWIFCKVNPLFYIFRLRFIAENSAFTDEAIISSWIPTPQTFLPLFDIMLT